MMHNAISALKQRTPMRIVQANNCAIMLPRERFAQRSHSEEEIVYALRVVGILGPVLVLAVIAALMVFMLLDSSLGLILSAGLLIAMGFWAFRIWKITRNASTRFVTTGFVTIIMDRRNSVVTFRSRHFLTAPTSVELLGKDVAEVVIDRMEWQGKLISFWRVWLHWPDGGYRLVDQGHKKEPIRKLAADLAEVLQVPLREPL
jgi:hypothetical protein